MCDDFPRKVNHILLQVSAFLGWLGAKPFRLEKYMIIIMSIQFILKYLPKKNIFKVRKLPKCESLNLGFNLELWRKYFYIYKN